MTNTYLSDDELEKMIHEIEHADGLHAPAYLKDEIVKRSYEIRPKKSKRTQLFWYGFQVMTVTAAAIILLFFLPVGDYVVRTLDHVESIQVETEDRLDEHKEKRNESEEKGNDSIFKKIDNGTNALCKKIYQFSDKLILKEEKNYD